MGYYARVQAPKIESDYLNRSGYRARPANQIHSREIQSKLDHHEKKDPYCPC